MDGKYKFLKKLCTDTKGQWLDEDNGIFITGTNGLVIGPYDELKAFATKLRVNYSAQVALINRKAKFGRRSTDTIPVGEIKKGGFRKLIKGRAADGDPEKYNIELFKRGQGTGFDLLVD